MLQIKTINPDNELTCLYWDWQKNSLMDVDQVDIFPWIDDKFDEEKYQTSWAPTVKFDDINEKFDIILQSEYLWEYTKPLDQITEQEKTKLKDLYVRLMRKNMFKVKHVLAYPLSVDRYDGDWKLAADDIRQNLGCNISLWMSDDDNEFVPVETYAAIGLSNFTTTPIETERSVTMICDMIRCHLNLTFDIVQDYYHNPQYPVNKRMLGYLIASIIRITGQVPYQFIDKQKDITFCVPNPNWDMIV